VSKDNNVKQNDSNDLPTEPAGAVREVSEPRLSDGRGGIPKFDLAEQILAEQRKITSIRRKAPGKKTEPRPSDGRGEPPAQKREVESIGYPARQKTGGVQQPLLTLSEQGQIIAEIVARDIEKLRLGDTSSLRRPDFRDTNI
jgi:hypothetical protein